MYFTNYIARCKLYNKVINYLIIKKKVILMEKYNSNIKLGTVTLNVVNLEK